MTDRQILEKRYQIDSLLGQGGMGLVYRGIDLETNSPIAIKVLRNDLTGGDPERITRFNQEAEVLRALNHPNIVKVLATAHEKGDQYLIMDFVPGGTLRELLDRDGPLRISTILEIALDLADALTRAHRLNIIHRDLKPSNVLLADDGTARLSDFGLARMGGKNITQVGVLIGTLVYLSPELCSGKPANSQTDVWALGVMLFELLTGKPPFEVEDALGTVLAITTEPTPNLEQLRPDAPVGLIDLIYRMLEKDPAARIPNMRLVGVALEAILAEINNSEIEISERLGPVGSRFASLTPHPAGLPKHNLPPQTTPFIGRDDELAALAELIDKPTTRLITLLGPGGIGKTRLASEVARAQLLNFKGGVTFVPFAPLRSVESIVPAIAEAVGIQLIENAAPKGQIFDYFQNRQTLLVFDNLEHLLDVADLVSELLMAAPDVKILATSREKLNLQHEIRFSITGMDFPGEDQPSSTNEAFQYSAIKLFMQAAKRARPGYVLDEGDMISIIQICRLVEGTPLGILLAASWIEMFSPQEIVAEIRRNLDFLEASMVDLPERHRSMRALFDSSWSQMSETERVTFMKLAIFRGGFRREAAQTVAGANLRDLVVMVCKSLLHRDPHSGRYEIHELLRQYAEAQLEASGVKDKVCNSHSNYYSSFLRERLRTMLGPNQVRALDEIEAEFRNIQQAWHWSIEQRNYSAIDEALEPLFVFSDMRSREHEGVALFEIARAQLAPQAKETPRPTWGRLLLPWHDLMLQSQGPLKDNKEIRAQAEISLADAQKHDDKLGIAYNLILLSDFVESGEALNNYHEALELVPRLDDSFWVRIRIGFCFRALGKYRKAREAFEKSYERGREIGENEKMGWSLYNIGETEIYLGDLKSALTHLREANNHFHQVGTLLGVIFTNIQLSLMMVLIGEFEAASLLVHEALEIAKDTNRTLAIRKDAQTIFGYLALVKGDYPDAQYIFKDVLSTSPPSPENFLGLSFADCGLGDYSAARRNLKFALDESSLFRSPVMALLCMPAAALIMAHDGQNERAGELLEVASHHPASPTELLEKWSQITKLSSELETKLPPNVITWAQERAQNLKIADVMASLKGQFGEPDAEKEKILFPSHSARESLVEPLSDRELDVLRLLKTELTGPEIARELTVSLNTIRFHTKNIYSKLQVNNRRGAVRRARELEL